MEFTARSVEDERGCFGGESDQRVAGTKPVQSQDHFETRHWEYVKIVVTEMVSHGPANILDHVGHLRKLTVGGVE